jgi:hypothetical protein
MIIMIKEKGVAYCGLACCICGKNTDCAGCRNDGCVDRNWCKNRNCCMEKGLNGCWECPEFPCKGSMLDKVRIRAFARFIEENSEDKLIECLEKNEKAGIIYHYKGELNGDYDKYDKVDDIIHMIEYGE